MHAGFSERVDTILNWTELNGKMAAGILKKKKKWKCFWTEPNVRFNLWVSEDWNLGAPVVAEMRWQVAQSSRTS